MWNSSINNPINVGLIDAIVEHENVKDHLGNKRNWTKQVIRGLSHCYPII